MKTKLFLHRHLAFFFLLAAFITASSWAALAGELPSLRVYQPAPGEPLSSQFIVKANGKPVPVYLATVLAMTSEQREKSDMQNFAPGELGQTSFASFDLRGAARISVTCPQPIKSIKLLPTYRGIISRVSGNSATFNLSRPGQFVLEVNGDTIQSLQIFANPWEKNVPRENDPNVVYYGPGIHKVTSVTITSGKTVYLAPDAVVYGTPGTPPGPVFDLKGDNITLRGRGIIDASLCPHPTRPIIAAEGNNISIEGVILRDSSAWTVPLTGCDQVKINNIKIIGHRGNADGIDVNGSRMVDIRNCYLRTGDDLIVIKTQILGKGNSRGVTVEHCVLWNELAHALSIGAELREPVGDIDFSDCDIIHDRGREWLLRIYQTDGAPIDHVTFRDIRIEECQKLISLWIGRNMYSQDAEGGHIDNVLLKNITSPAPLRAGSPVELVDVDANHAIHNVKFDHVVVDGKPLGATDVAQDAFAQGITYLP